MARATLCEGLWLRRVRDLVAGVTMTALCPCQECDSALRRIAIDAGDVAALARMTEPERRRAAGEAPFLDNEHTVRMAQAFTRWEFVSPIDGWKIEWWAQELIVAHLRALVQQEIVDRIVAWCEAEVSP